MRPERVQGWLRRRVGVWLLGYSARLWADGIEGPSLFVKLLGEVVLGPPVPMRVQLRRTKGWRKPEGAVVVARPSRWGNPFVVGRPSPPYTAPGEVVRDRAHAVDLFRRWVGTRGLPEGRIADLQGRDLACWCPLDQPCHADVLLELANA